MAEEGSLLLVANLFIRLNMLCRLGYKQIIYLGLISRSLICRPDMVETGCGLNRTQHDGSVHMWEIVHLAHNKDHGHMYKQGVGVIPTPYTSKSCHEAAVGQPQA